MTGHKPYQEEDSWVVVNEVRVDGCCGPPEVDEIGGSFLEGTTGARGPSNNKSGGTPLSERNHVSATITNYSPPLLVRYESIHRQPSPQDPAEFNEWLQIFNNHDSPDISDHGLSNGALRDRIEEKQDVPRTSDKALTSVHLACLFPDRVDIESWVDKCNNPQDPAFFDTSKTPRARDYDGDQHEEGRTRRDQNTSQHATLAEHRQNKIKGETDEPEYSHWDEY